MVQLHPITDNSVVNAIFTKNSLTEQERFILDSYVFTPLVNYCGDIRPNEVAKVQAIEDDCVCNFINVIMPIFTDYNKEIHQKLLSMQPFASYISTLNSMNMTKEEKERAYITVIPRLILANGNKNLKAKVQGKMPQKMFSFRQMTADEWFDNFVLTGLTRIAFVYEKLGANTASASAFALCAYFLYNSQPNRFDISKCNNANDALYLILKEFLESKGVNTANLYSSDGMILSKSL